MTTLRESDLWPTYTPHGFIWGNLEVTRLAHVRGRGRVLVVSPEGQPYSKGLQVYISEGGRSVRVWKGGRELK
jgi:hypothetical protein